MKRFLTFVLLGVIALTLTGCLAGSPEADQLVSTGWPGSLILGFWHGLIAPLSFLMEQLQNNYPGVLHTLPYEFWGPWHIYDTHNASFVYNIGFCFGLFFLPSFIWARPKILM